eukprot:TRINITY_DN13576_c0_g1_i1.p2 TRINITY_DN13576_c0_g1~~TRINITY_DN13576_c0_g1_i1.p2  ORF type:complete len:104 (-),score=16.34 TRINITY_DN13576_c0_g1_i1:11-322(-)
MSGKRVNYSLLPQHIGTLVTIVGKVINRVPNGVILETSDQAQVTIHTNMANNYDVFVEVVGTVNPDLSIREQSFTNFGANFDLANYDEVIKLQQNPVVRELFV